jgi:Tol biopolymer transport system component
MLSYLLFNTSSHPHALGRYILFDQLVRWQPQGKYVLTRGGVASIFTQKRSVNEPLALIANWVDVTPYPNHYCDGGVDWSPQGDRVAFSPVLQGFSDTVQISSIFEWKPIRLVGDRENDRCWCPLWEPKGKRIAFKNNKPGIDNSFKAVSLDVIDADGSNRKTLIADKLSVGIPLWSPKGGKILLCLLKETGLFPIVVDATSGKVQEMPRINPLTKKQIDILDLCGNMTWHPNGQKVYFLDDGAGFVWDLTTNELKYLFPIDGNRMPPHMCISPDGSTLAYIADEDREALILHDLKHNTKQTIRLSLERKQVGEIRWSPNGKWIACEVDYSVLLVELGKQVKFRMIQAKHKAVVPPDGD